MSADARYCSKCGHSFAKTSATNVDADLEYLETAVGPRNTDYYLRRFQRFSTGDTLASWNWPAFFVSLIWLLYRKMWAYAAAYFFLPTVLNLIVVSVLGLWFGEGTAAIGVLLFDVVVFFVIFPTFANALYYRVVRKRIEHAKTYASDRERQLRALAAEGGTSNAALVLVVFLIIPFIGILAAIAIPAYQDYTIRAQVSEGLNVAATAKAAVAETILSRREAPEDRSDAGLSPDPRDSSGMYVASVSVNGGRIDIEYGRSAHSVISGRMLSLTPYLEMRSDDDTRIVWRCGFAPVPQSATHEVSRYQPGTIDQKYLPSACRR